MKVALTYRVLQHWRTPVFRRLAATPDVDFVALHGSDFPGTSVVNGRDLSGFRHRELATWRPFSWLPGGRDVPIPLCPGLLPALARERPDVILAEGGSNLLNNLQVFAYAAATRTPVVWWTLGEIRVPGPLPRSTRLFRWLAAKLERRATALLGYSSLAVDYFERQGYPRERQFRAVNCVDTDRIEAETERARDRVEPLRRELGLEDGTVLLFVGALNPGKRLEDLIDVHGRLAARHPELTLLIVGDGGHRAALEERASETPGRVVFTGAVVDDVAAYFELGDVFVLPGLGGLAISEAMVHGLPVIATEADGCELDLVENGKSGQLLRPGDQAALEACLETLVTRTDTRRAMAARSRAIIDERFNINTYMEAVLDALRFAVSGRRETAIPTGKSAPD